MSTLLLIAAIVIVVGVLARAFVTQPPADLARYIRMGSGIALMGLGVGLLFLRQFALALPAGIAGFVILRRNMPMRPSGAAGGETRVRSAGLEMMLDHQTGAMDGRVLAGRHEGRMLSDLNLGELMEVGSDFAGDAESLRLVESYLDRTHPGWRDDVQADQTQRQSTTPRSGGMDANEAYQILGLEPGASEADVREAHRRLMKQVHPDRGGSAALAAKINEAKDRILGRHRQSRD
jgi:hypothetical protein